MPNRRADDLQDSACPPLALPTLLDDVLARRRFVSTLENEQFVLRLAAGRRGVHLVGAVFQSSQMSEANLFHESMEFGCAFP
jgi:hypothetical protein